PLVLPAIQQRIPGVRTARFHVVKARPDIAVSRQTDTPGIHDVRGRPGNMRVPAQDELSLAHTAQPRLNRFRGSEMHAILAAVLEKILQIVVRRSVTEQNAFEFVSRRQGLQPGAMSAVELRIRGTVRWARL